MTLVGKRVQTIASLIDFSTDCETMAVNISISLKSYAVTKTQGKQQRMWNKVNHTGENNDLGV